MAEPRWRMLAILFLGRTVMGLQFQTIASTEAALRQAVGISFAEVGTLIGAYMLPGVLLAFPGGLLVRRFGDRQVCCAGLALMAAGGVLVGYGQGLGVVMIGRLISGVGGVFLSLAITKMVTDWFAGREIVTAMSVMLTSWPVGIGAGLLLFAPLTIAYSWSSVMYLAAAASVAAMLLIWTLYRSPTILGSPQTSPAGKPALVLPSRQEALSVISAGAAWGLLNVGLVAFFSFVPPLLAGHGFSLAGAASVTSLVLWLMIVSMPIGGHWLQARGHPDPVVMVLSALLAAVMVALALAPVAAIPLGFALAALFGPPPGAIMAMPGRVLRPDTRAAGLGLFLTVYYVLMALGPAAAGMLGDRFGLAAPVLFGAAVFLAIPPLVAVFALVSRPTATVAPKPAT